MTNSDDALAESHPVAVFIEAGVAIEPFLEQAGQPSGLRDIKAPGADGRFAVPPDLRQCQRAALRAGRVATRAVVAAPGSTGADRVGAAASSARSRANQARQTTKSNSNLERWCLVNRPDTR